MAKDIKIQENYLATIPSDSPDMEYLRSLKSTLSEWESENDEEDFSDLQKNRKVI